MTRDDASVRVAFVASTMTMLFTSLLLAAIGWAMWERQVPIWMMGFLAFYLTLRRCDRVMADREEKP